MTSKFFISVIIFFISTSSVFAQIKIGVALPLMKNSEEADENKLAEQILKGINDALKEYNSDKLREQVNIEVEDTGKDPSITLDILNKFGSDTGCIGVFGPVFSSELLNNAGAAAYHKIPVISPTATYNFLAAKNDYVFQLNPTYDIRGGIMAKFAMNELGMKNFVILSEESYGKNFEESFKAEVNKNSGSIIISMFYSKDKESLSDELRDLKDKLFENEKFLDFGNMTSAQLEKLKKLKFQFSNADSLVNEKLIVSIYKLFGKKAEKVLDSEGISYNSKSITDNSGKYILGYADGVYIPVSNSNEISKIVSEYFSENINLPILGTSDWNNEDILEENKIYIKDLYFDSDFFLKDNYEVIKNSNNDFANLTETEIRNYYFGYDGMKLILEKISEGNKSRQSLNESLQKINDYKAIHNNVTIKERTNHQMTIMNYRNGILNKLKDYVF